MWGKVSEDCFLYLNCQVEGVSSVRPIRLSWGPKSPTFSLTGEKQRAFPGEDQEGSKQTVPADEECWKVSWGYPPNYCWPPQEGRWTTCDEDEEVMASVGRNLKAFGCQVFLKPSRPACVVRRVLNMNRSGSGSRAVICLP